MKGSLAASISKTFDIGELSISQSKAIIKLIEKKDKRLECLKNVLD